MPRYPHLTVPTAPETLRFTSIRSARPQFNTPPRNRANHAGKLIGEIQAATAGAGRTEAVGNGFYLVNDLTITFESDPDFPLAFESLDLQTSGINLLSVSKDEANAANLDRWLLDRCAMEGVDGFPTRMLLRSGPNATRKREDFNRAVGILAEHGRVRLVEVGKRRSVTVNPALLDGSAIAGSNNRWHD